MTDISHHSYSLKLKKYLALRGKRLRLLMEAKRDFLILFAFVNSEFEASTDIQKKVEWGLGDA